MSDSTLTRHDIARMRERAEKATAGPWEPLPKELESDDPWGSILPGRRDDYEFIVESRTDLPRLCDAMEAAVSHIRYFLSNSTEPGSDEYRAAESFIAAYDAADAATAREGE